MRLYSWISLSPTSNSERSRSPKAEAEQDLERHTRQSIQRKKRVVPLPNSIATAGACAADVPGESAGQTHVSSWTQGKPYSVWRRLLTRPFPTRGRGEYERQVGPSGGASRPGVVCGRRRRWRRENASGLGELLA